MKWAFIPDRIDYDGSQLAAHFAFRRASLAGDSIISFIGACDVSASCMVDVADLADGCTIVSREMLHFIVEHFDRNLERAVLRQRTLVSLLQQEVNVRLREYGDDRYVIRDGDDLFLGGSKLTVSVATASHVSCLIHLGVNIDPEGAPVEAIGLQSLLPKERPEQLASFLMEKYAAEMASVHNAMALVRGVSEFGGGKN
ncbi:MAG: DUF366 family protein [Candidatus Coatesbacteria bacterium]|nr:DUF366 family protein [Candidatus Coatesbacteria bacterium]